MIDSNYEVYIQLKDFVYKSILFDNLKFNEKKVVTTVYEIACQEYSKFILILNATINIITLRVYSTGENSKKYVDVSLTFELVSKCDIDVLTKVIKDSVRQAIELTIKEMAK